MHFEAYSWTFLRKMVLFKFDSKENYELKVCFIFLEEDYLDGVHIDSCQIMTFGILIRQEIQLLYN